MLRAHALVDDLLDGEVPHIFRGPARPKLTRRNAFSGAQQSACGQHAVRLDLAAIHHDCAQPHKRMVVQLAPVDHRQMPDQHIVADLGAVQPGRDMVDAAVIGDDRSEAHTSALPSLMRISYAVFCLKKKTRNTAKTVTYTKLQDQTYSNTILSRTTNTVQSNRY